MNNWMPSDQEVELAAFAIAEAEYRKHPLEFDFQVARSALLAADTCRTRGESRDTSKEELVREALGILTDLHDSIAKHGNYSAESTMCFVDQAASALRDSLSRAPEPVQETLL